MVVVTLDHMAAGGIYDHLGGGFHRYSVDAEWLVPHFEKMLYDNAMLANCYLDAWQETKRHDYLRVVRETLDYVLRDMTDPLGGFHSAEDADSEGDEGRFYVWTPQEVQAVLGPERAAAFCKVYDVTASGNFEGSNILHLSKPIAVCGKILGRDAASLEERSGGRSDQAAGCPGPPRAARPRRQGARELERADDRRHGPGRRRARRTALPYGCRGRRGLPLAHVRDERGACCTVGARARRGTTPSSTIMPACATP